MFANDNIWNQYLINFQSQFSMDCARLALQLDTSSGLGQTTMQHDSRLWKSAFNLNSKYPFLQVRFSSPVLPGQTLVTEMWNSGDNKIHFQTKADNKHTVQKLIDDFRWRKRAKWSSRTPGCNWVRLTANRPLMRNMRLKCEHEMKYNRILLHGRH